MHVPKPYQESPSGLFMLLSSEVSYSKYSATSIPPYGNSPISILKQSHTSFFGTNARLGSSGGARIFSQGGPSGFII